ncbi:MAG: hypothetical protein HZA25_02115 [Candidatus Niyogibacteria bacterium]|nr:hypothetical protein [Candidatus Niyogibacteria bacterium]
MRPLNKVKIKWSSEFAYAIGLLTTDGNLSPDGRHLNFTSKDEELVETFKKCLGLKNKIGRKARSGGGAKKYFVIQFGDIIFYDFLLQIGLCGNKSKKLGALDISQKYFYDFLRGHLDGDGTFYSYFDPRWRSSFMFYTVFISASKKHIEWLRGELSERLGIKGHISKAAGSSIYSLRYAKAETLKLLPKLYYDSEVVCLSRKRRKIERAIGKIV